MRAPSQVPGCGTDKRRANEVGRVFPGFDIFEGLPSWELSRFTGFTSFESGMTGANLGRCCNTTWLEAALEIYDPIRHLECHELKKYFVKCFLKNIFHTIPHLV